MSESLEHLPTAEQIALMLSIEGLSTFAKLIQSGHLIVSAAAKIEAVGERPEPKTPDLGPGFTIKPLETLEAIDSKLKLLIAGNAQLANDLEPISNDLTGLRGDIAALLAEVKDGSSNLIAAQAAQSDMIKKSQEASDARLGRLEEDMFVVTAYSTQAGDLALAAAQMNLDDTSQQETNDRLDRLEEAAKF